MVPGRSDGLYPPFCCSRLSSGRSEEGSRSLDQVMRFAQSRAKLREAAKLQEAIEGPVPWQGISRAPGCPCCPWNTSFPRVLLSRNAVLPGAGVAAGGPGGRAPLGAL